MTTIATVSGAEAGNRILLTAALADWQSRQGDAARPAPDGISSRHRPAIDCRSPL